MTDKGTSGQSVQKSPELTEGLFLMDGIEGLRSLPRHSVDMLLTDPPYGTTRNFWDVPLPLPELWEAVKWAVKPDGAILFFAQCPYDKVLGASNLSMLRYEWVWYKSRCTGFLNARRAPLKKTENILVFYQKLPLYNPQFEQGKPYKRSLTNNGDSPNYGKFVRTTGGSEDGLRFPGNVLTFPTVQRTVHPTQKPVALCEYFIKTYTRSISSRPTPAPASWWRTSARAPAQRRWPPSTRAATSSVLKPSRPTMPPPVNASAWRARQWRWRPGRKECNYRTVFCDLCRSPLALHAKGLAGCGGEALPHNGD